VFVSSKKGAFWEHVFILQTLLQDELLELSGDEVSKTAVLQDINDLLAM
jgi:hypothetical protein